MGEVVKLKGVDSYSLRRRERRHRMIKIARVVMIIAILIVIIAGLITPFSLKEKGVHTLGMVVYGAIGLGGLTLLDYIIKKQRKEK